MPFEFFDVPIQDQGQAEATLDDFLLAYRALAVDRRWMTIS